MLSLMKLYHSAGEKTELCKNLYRNVKKFMRKPLLYSAAVQCYNKVQ